MPDAWTPQSNSHIPVVIVTGLSGAGKSTALKVFEDLGFFSVDGLPASMMDKLVSLFQKENPGYYRGIALGIDIRQRNFLQDWWQARDHLRLRGINPRFLFLEAGIDTLLKRYAETRRPHPLVDKDVGLETALRKEQELLSPLRQEVGLILDTSEFSIHDLRRALQAEWNFLQDPSLGLRVNVLSFGYKYGTPREADLIFDLRFLPNPYFEERFRGISGKEPEVVEYIFQSDIGAEFKQRFVDFLLYILPLYAREGRYRVTLGLGCTGGFHRSVAVAEEVHRILQEQGYHVSLEHRHMELKA